MPVMRSSDQKILQLMIAKREAEKKQDEQRESVRSKWEEDRKREAAAKNSAENQRRRSSVPVDKKRPSRTDHCHHNGTDQECSCGRDHNRQVVIPSRQVKSSPSVRRVSQSDENGESCRRSWVVASQKRLEMQKQQLQEKKMRELERKRSVEKRLEEQRRENEEYQNKLKQKQNQALERAESVRISKEQQKELTTRLRNFQAQQKHKEKMNQIKRQSMEDLSSMRASIDLRDHLSHGQRKDLVGHNERESKRRSLDLDQRLKQCKENKTKMDSDLKHWHADLQRYRQLQEDRAEKQAKQNIQQKSKKVQEHLTDKQKLHQDNLKKIQSAEEEWKAEVEATIALKDSKSKMVQREKEDLIQESRAMAQTSQRLREELRHHYSMNDLDRLNKQVELEARITNRFMHSPS